MSALYVNNKDGTKTKYTNPGDTRADSYKKMLAKQGGARQKTGPNETAEEYQARTFAEAKAAQEAEAAKQANTEAAAKAVTESLQASAQRSGVPNTYQYDPQTKEVIVTRQVQQAITRPNADGQLVTTVINKEQQIKEQQEATTNNDLTGRTGQADTGNRGNPLTGQVSADQTQRQGKQETSVLGNNPYSDGRDANLEGYEQRIQRLNEYEQRVNERAERSRDIFRAIPGLRGDNFLQRGTRYALSIPGSVVTELPERVNIAFQKTYAAGEGLFRPETRQATAQELGRAGQETPAAVGQALDPRTPEGIVNLGLALTGVRGAGKAKATGAATADLRSGTKTIKDIETGKIKDTTVVEGEVRAGKETFQVKGASTGEAVPKVGEAGAPPATVRVERGVVRVTDAKGKSVDVPIRTDTEIRNGRRGSREQGQFVYQVPEGEGTTTTQGSLKGISKPSSNVGEIITKNPEELFPEQPKNPKADKEFKRILKDNKIVQFGFEKEAAAAAQSQNILRKQGTIAPLELNYPAILREEGIRKADFTAYQRGQVAKTALTIEDTTKQIPKGETNYFTREAQKAPQSETLLSKPAAVETGRGEGFTLLDLDTAQQVIKAPKETLTTVKTTLREQVRNLFRKKEPKVSSVAETKTATAIEFDTVATEPFGTVKAFGKEIPVQRAFPAEVKITQGKTKAVSDLSKPVPQPKPKPVDVGIVLEPELKPTKGFTTLEGETVTRGNAKGQGVKQNVFTGEVKGFGGPQETVQTPKPVPQPPSSFAAVVPQAVQDAVKVLQGPRPVKGPVAILSSARITQSAPVGRVQARSAATVYYEEPTKPKPPIQEAKRVTEQSSLAATDLREAQANVFKPASKSKARQETDQAQEQIPAQKPVSIQDSIQERKPAQKQAQQQRQRTTPRSVLPPSPLAQPKPKAAIIPFGSDDEAPGVNVKVRRRGKFFQLNTEPLSKEEAKNLGAAFVEKTLGATFKLEDAGAPATGKYNGPTKTLKDFYKSKKEPNTYIQKAPARLGRRSEVSEIQRSKRFPF